MRRGAVSGDECCGEGRAFASDATTSSPRIAKRPSPNKSDEALLIFPLLAVLLPPTEATNAIIAITCFSLCWKTTTQLLLRVGLLDICAERGPSYRQLWRPMQTMPTLSAGFKCYGSLADSARVQ